ncbi:unnamed protein product [Closterium sp. NIES-53]
MWERISYSFFVRNGIDFFESDYYFRHRLNQAASFVLAGDDYVIASTSSSVIDRSSAILAGMSLLRAVLHVMSLVIVTNIHSPLLLRCLLSGATGDAVVCDVHGETVVRASSHGEAVVRASSHGETVVPALSLGETVVRASSHGGTVVCASSHDETVVRASSHGGTVVRASSHGKTVVCASSHGGTVVRALSHVTVVRASSHGETVVRASSHGETIVCASARGEVVVRDSFHGEMVARLCVPLRYRFSPPKALQPPQVPLGICGLWMCSSSGPSLALPVISPSHSRSHLPRCLHLVPHGAPLPSLPSLPSHPFPARRAQAKRTEAGEQQARGAPGARAAGQQRRPHQRLRLQYRPCHHTPLEPTPPQVQVQVQVQVGSGSCGVVVGVTCTVVCAGARVFGTFLHCNPSYFRLPFLSALPSLPSLLCQAFTSQGDGSRRAAGEGSTRAGRAAGARAAGQQRRPHQRLRLQYRPCHHTPLEPTPPQVQVQVQVQVTGRGVGSTPTLPHAPPLWSCREEAPGGGLLRREAAGGTRGDGREAALQHGNLTAARESIGMGLASQGKPRTSLSRCTRFLLTCPRAHPFDSPLPVSGPAFTPLLAFPSVLPPSRSLAMQQRQLTGPVVAASAAGSTDAAVEGREGEGGISREAALQLPAKCFRLAGLTLAGCSLLMLNYSCRFCMGFSVLSLKSCHWLGLVHMLLTSTLQVTLSGAGTPLRFLFRCSWGRTQEGREEGCSGGRQLSCSRVWEWQWRGAVTGNMEWEWQSAAAFHPNHPQLSPCPSCLPLTHFSSVLSLPVEGRGVGVNTATPSRSSPVAVQVAVVGGEGGSTRLGWDGKGKYWAGLSETSTAASRLKAPPPLTAAPDKYTLPSRPVNAFALSHMHSHMHLHITFPSMLHASSLQAKPLAAA